MYDPDVSSSRCLCRSLVRNIRNKMTMNMIEIDTLPQKYRFNPSASYGVERSLSHSSLWFFCCNDRDLCYPSHHLYNRSFLCNFIWGVGEMGLRHSPSNNLSRTPVFLEWGRVGPAPWSPLKLIRCPVLVTTQWVRTVPSYSFKSQLIYSMSGKNF